MITTQRTREPGVVLVRIDVGGDDENEERENDCLVAAFEAIDAIYEANEGFGIIFDISSVDIQLTRHWCALLRAGQFFHGMGTQRRARASRGVAVVVKTEDSCSCVNRALALFPSPVPVWCCSTLYEALDGFSPACAAAPTPITL